ncbi:MAG: hypothetical protein IT319_19490 [Anaerolineae bacterium]|nr:hypothetical protein [Anaerolineae bacterium]
MRKAVAGIVCAAAVFTPFTAIRAQDCEIDLRGAIERLTDAQAADDISAALAMIASVQRQLDDIQQACAGVSGGASGDLAQTFSAPGAFRFQYPDGWIEGEFHAGRDWETLLAPANTQHIPLPQGGTMTVTRVETPLTYSPYVALPNLQSVTVLVGSPLHLFNELGLYSEAFAEQALAGGFGFDALAQALESGIRRSPMQPDLLLTRIDAERPTVGFEAYGNDTTLTMVLVALDEDANLYALLVSPTLADDRADMLPLLEAMAATVQPLG